MPILEIVSDLFEQSGLIALGGEMVICPTLDQVTGKFALREQGISGDGSPGDFDGIEQRRGRFYLVGAFFLIAALGTKGADFFWV